MQNPLHWIRALPASGYGRGGFMHTGVRMKYVSKPTDARCAGRGR